MTTLIEQRQKQMADPTQSGSRTVNRIFEGKSAVEITQEERTHPTTVAKKFAQVSSTAEDTPSAISTFPAAKELKKRNDERAVKILAHTLWNNKKIGVATKLSTTIKDFKTLVKHQLGEQPTAHALRFICQGRQLRGGQISLAAAGIKDFSTVQVSSAFLTGGMKKTEDSDDDHFWNANSLNSRVKIGDDDDSFKKPSSIDTFEIQKQSIEYLIANDDKEDAPIISDQQNDQAQELKRILLSTFHLSMSQPSDPELRKLSQDQMLSIFAQHDGSNNIEVVREFLDRVDEANAIDQKSLMEKFNAMSPIDEKTKLVENKLQKETDFVKRAEMLLIYQKILERVPKEIVEDMAETSGNLTITVVEARLTRDTELIGKMDPYVEIQNGQQKFKTAVKDGAGKTPVFNETFEVNVNYIGDFIILTVLEDDGPLNADTVGQAKIKLSTLCVSNDIDDWFQIRFEGKDAGQVHLKTVWQPTVQPVKQINPGIMLLEKDNLFVEWLFKEPQPDALPTYIEEVIGQLKIDDRRLLDLLQLFHCSQTESILDAIVNVQKLETLEKNKFFSFANSLITSTNLKNLFKIDPKKGYDPSNVKWREIALQTLTRERLINLLEKMLSSESISQLIETLKCNRNVRISAEKHGEIIKNILYEDLPPLPTIGLSRILAFVSQLELEQIVLFKLLIQLPPNTFVVDDPSDQLSQTQLDVINGASVLGLTEQETIEVLTPAKSSFWDNKQDTSTDDLICKAFAKKFKEKPEQEQETTLQELGVFQLREACFKVCSAQVVKQLSQKKQQKGDELKNAVLSVEAIIKDSRQRILHNRPGRSPKDTLNNQSDWVAPENSLFNRVQETERTPQELVNKLDKEILDNQVNISVHIAGKYQPARQFLHNPNIFVTLQYKEKSSDDLIIKENDQKIFSIDEENLQLQGLFVEKEVLLKIWNVEDDQKPRLQKEFQLNRPALLSKGIDGGPDNETFKVALARIKLKKSTLDANQLLYGSKGEVFLFCQDQTQSGIELFLLENPISEPITYPIAKGSELDSRVRLGNGVIGQPTLIKVSENMRVIAFADFDNIYVHSLEHDKLIVKVVSAGHPFLVNCFPSSDKTHLDIIYITDVIGDATGYGEGIEVWARETVSLQKWYQKKECEEVSFSSSKIIERTQAKRKYCQYYVENFPSGTWVLREQPQDFNKKSRTRVYQQKQQAITDQSHISEFEFKWESTDGNLTQIVPVQGAGCWVMNQQVSGTQVKFKLIDPLEVALKKTETRLALELQTKDTTTQMLRTSILEKNGNKKLVGSFTNSKDGSISWFWIEISNSEQNQAILDLQRVSVNSFDYQIQYPLICSVRSKSQLELTNLAAKEQLPILLNLQNSIFLQFVDSDGIRGSSTVEALCMQSSKDGQTELQLTRLNYKRPFEGTSRLDQSCLEVEKLPLPDYEGLKHESCNLKKVCILEVYKEEQDGYVHSGGLVRDRTPALVFQTNTSIFLQNKGKPALDYFNLPDQKSEAKMKKIGMQRISKRPYAGEKQGEFAYETTFFAVQSNPDNSDALIELKASFRDLNQKYWTLSKREIYAQTTTIVAFQIDQSVSSDLNAPNQLFVLTRSNVLLHLREEETSYRILKKLSLSHIKGLSADVQRLMANPFPTLSMSEGSLTIEGTTILIETGDNQSLNYKREGEGWKIWQTETNPRHNLQVHVATQRIRDEDQQSMLIVKADPTSRKVRLLDNKSQRDVLLCGFVSQELILFKMLSKQEGYAFQLEEKAYSDESSYWTLMNAITSEIVEMPHGLWRVLSSENWTLMKTQATGNSRTQVLLKSDTQVAELTFNLQGVLLQSDKFPFDLRQHPLRIDAKGFLPQIFSETVFSSHGELYLVANGLHEDGLAHQGEVSVCCSPSLSGAKSLNTVILLRSKEFFEKIDSDESNFFREGTQFAGCGNYLCLKDQDKKQAWPFPVEEFEGEVFVIALDDIKLTSEETMEGTPVIRTPAKRRIVLTAIVKQMSLKDSPIVSIEPCPWLFQLYRQSGTLEDIEAEMKKMSMLQVTVGSRAMVFDLTDQKLDSPPVISDFVEVQDFMNPETHVESPIIMTQATKDNYKLGVASTSKRTNVFTRYLLKQEILSNCQGSLFLKTSTIQSSRYRTRVLSWVEAARPFFGLYRTFNELELMEIKRIVGLINEDKNVDQVNLNQLLAVVEGQTIFSLFKDDVSLLKQVTKQLEEVGNEDGDDASEEPLFMRRLKLILSLATLPTKADTQEKSPAETQLYLTCVLRESLQQSNAKARDQLLKIATMCKNFAIFGVIPNQDSLAKVFESVTPTITQWLNKCFLETYGTQSIRQVKLSKGQNTVTFRSKNCVLDSAQVQAEINKKEIGTEMTQVVLGIHELNWLYQGGNNFSALIQMINSCQSNAIYEAELVRNFLNEFWEGYFDKLLWNMFIPFTTHCILVFTFLFLTLASDTFDASVASDEDTKDSMHWYIVGVGCLAMCTWLHEALYEIKQLISDSGSLTVHFNDLYNICDFVHLNFTLCLFIVNVPMTPMIEKETQRFMAAIITFALMIKMYDALRLFEKPAFYILLISETFKDVSSFLLLFLIALMMFGFPTMFINLNRPVDMQIIGSVSGVAFLDAVLTQYSSSLAGYPTDNFVQEGRELDTVLCVLFYLLATIFCQITMLNMVIAIMGDSFARISEDKVVYAVIGRLALFGKYAFVLKDSANSNTEGNFLYVVTPADDEQEKSSSSSASLSKMQAAAKKQMGATEAILEAKFAYLNEKLNDINSNIDMKIQTLAQQNSSLNERIVYLNDKLNERLDEENANLNLKLTLDNEALNKQLKEDNYNLNKRLDIDSSKLNSKLTDDNANLNVKLNEDNESLKKKLNEDNASLQEKMNRENAILQEKLTLDNDTLQKKLNEDSENLKKKMAEENANVNEKIGDLNKRLNSSSQDLNDKIATLNQKLINENNTYINDKLGSLKEQLDEKISENKEVLTGQIQSLNQTLNERLNGDMGQLTEQITDLNRFVEQLRQQIEISNNSLANTLDTLVKTMANQTTSPGQQSEQ